MKTKGGAYRFFDEKVSKSCIERTDDGVYIYGRYATVRFCGKGVYEIFLHNIHDFIIPLHGRRVEKFMELMGKYKLVNFHRWDGEAMAQTQDKRALLDNLKWLGIRRKRVMPEGWVVPWKR